MTTLYTKDPDAVLDYVVSWADFLGVDTIATSVWTVAAGDVVIDSYSHTGTTTTVWLSGGTVSGTRALVTNHITTDGGRADDRTFRILVTEK